MAPEDSRYGQDILIPKNATANAAMGQVVQQQRTLLSRRCKSTPNQVAEHLHHEVRTNENTVPARPCCASPTLVERSRFKRSSETNLFDETL